MSVIRAIGKTVTKATLAEMSADSELEGFMIVGIWKDGTISTGWTSMKLSQLAYGLKSLELEVNSEIIEVGEL